MKATGRSPEISQGAGRATTGVATGPAFGSHGSASIERALWRLADARGLAPLARARLRRLAARLAPGPFDIVAEEIRLRAYPADNYSDRVALARGRLPDRDERAALAPFLPAGGVFVDIGANAGLYALWAAQQVGPTGTVIAAEPHPELSARLAFNAAANGCSNIRIIAAAIGGAAGTAILHSSAGGNVGQSSLIAEVAFRPDAAFEVPLRPLRAVLVEAGLERVDALKVDVEGYEDRVVVPFLEEAAEALLPRAVLIETDVAERWLTDCRAAFAARGYRLAMTTAANAMYIRGDGAIA